jgi:cell division septation protein DedD
MLPGKLLITGILAITLLAGCNKKKSDDNNEFSSTPKPAATPAATQDIFDEFYKEDAVPEAKTEKTQKTQPVSRPGAAVAFSENGRYVVQVSTQPSQRLADALAAKLSAKGYPSYVAEVQNPTPSLSGTFYRVRIGGFSTIADARSFGNNELAADGYEYWVDRRSNDNVGLEGYGMGSGGSAEYSTPAQSPGNYETYTSQPPAAPVSTYTPEPAPSPAVNPPATTSQPATTPPAAKPSTTSEWGNDDW